MTVTEDIPFVADPNSPPVFSLGGLIESLVIDAAARYEARLTGNPLGVLTGFPELDYAMGGSVEPGLHCLHAEPGVGKTAFALQMAAACRCPALFVTCEVSTNELLRRHTARCTDTKLSQFKTGELHPDTIRAKVIDAAAKAPNLSIMDATKNAATTGFIEAEIMRLRRNSPHFLLIIDSLHAWARRSTPPGVASNEMESLNFGLGALGGLAASQKIPVLYIAERNRGSMKDSGQSSGAGTRVIEYGAETVIALSKVSEHADGDGWKTLVLSLPKNRHGQVNKEIDFEWNGDYQEFRKSESKF